MINVLIYRSSSSELSLLRNSIEERIALMALNQSIDVLSLEMA